MAEEGNKTEVQEEATPSGEPTIEHINAELQLTSPPPPDSHTDWRASIQDSEGWLKAIAADEHTQQRGRNHGRASAPSKRSPASTRGMYRAHRDWNRTVRGIQRQTHAQLSPRHPSPPFAKTNDSVVTKFLTKVWEGIFRIFGVQ